jgi:orotate phosphoribosyltransferase
MKNIEEILNKTGAIKKGHFKLASGNHSQYYFQAQSMLQYPDYASDIGNRIAALWRKEEIQTVVSLAIGGIVIGQEVARSLGIRHIFLERKDTKFSLRRGFSLEKGEKILLIEDVITTGGSLKEAISIITPLGAEIVGITAIVVRGNPSFTYTLKHLYSIDWPKYSEEECPFCKEGIPLQTPGTKQSKEAG